MRGCAGPAVGKHPPAKRNCFRSLHITAEASLSVITGEPGDVIQCRRG